MLVTLFLAEILIHFAYGGKANIKWEKETLFSPSWTLFEGSAKWYKCPAGSVVAGFWRNDCDALHCIEQMKCVAPSASPILSQSCYTKNIWSSFDSGTTVECDAGYFIRGIFSNENHNGDCGLGCWEELECCKYDGLSFDPSASTQDWWNCFGQDQVWCTVDNGEFITGFYRSPAGDEKIWLGEIWLLEEAKTRRLYDECRVTSVDAPAQLITKSMDTFSNLIYTNLAYETRMTTTMDNEASIEKESTFTHKAGLEIGASITFGVSGGFFGASVSTEMSLSVTATQEFEQTVTNKETITQSTPAVEYPCSARTTCTRERILYKAPEQEVEITINMLCNTLGPRSIVGNYIAKGGTEIVVIDSTTPMDCSYYTNDYYDRNNDKLAHCWNCNSNSKCNTCGDGKVELDDGQCYNDDVCLECGGEVQSIPSYGESIGKFCSGEDMTTSKCISFIQGETSR